MAAQAPTCSSAARGDAIAGGGGDAGNTIIRINLDADAEVETGLPGIRVLTLDEFML